MTIYHIASKDEWDQAKKKGHYDFCSLKTEGFIHSSTENQFLEVANRLFRGKDGLVLLEIEERLVESEIIYENLEGGEEKYPHIYGPLNLSAIVKVHPFPCGEDGFFQSPLVKAK